ncbi:MAG: PTS fructose transporter subunit IIA [Burkholderiales bacterium]|jgi:PTS system ascorbate-specific IIA component|nr:PTS fructose transporter subunit IIA [Burkholderiales bacterium]
MNPPEKKPPAKVGVLLLMHEPLAEAFVEVLTHVMGGRPSQCEALPVLSSDNAETLFGKVKARVDALNQGAGVLIFSDICGATPYRVAQQIVEPQRVALVCGASVPMLVRALTYREAGLEVAVEKALSGGHQGVMCVKNNDEEGDCCHAAS